MFLLLSSSVDPLSKCCSPPPYPAPPLVHSPSLTSTHTCRNYVSVFIFPLFLPFLFTKLGHSRGSEREHERRLKDNCRIILSKLRVNINTLNLALGRVSHYNLQKNINESPLCFWHTLMRHRSFRGFVGRKITHGESRAPPPPLRSHLTSKELQLGGGGGGGAGKERGWRK